MFEVQLKKGHPTGVYHRSGKEFTASALVLLEDDEVTSAIRKDRWLDVRKVREVSRVPTLAEYVKRGYKAENYERTFFGLKPGDPYDENAVEANLKKAEAEREAKAEEEKKRPSASSDFANNAQEGGGQTSAQTTDQQQQSVPPTAG